MLGHKDHVGTNADRLTLLPSAFALWQKQQCNDYPGARLWHFQAVSYLVVSTAVPTDASKHAIYYLNKTQDEFNSTKCQEDRKESDIPFHDVLGFDALGPCGPVQKVSVGEKRNLRLVTTPNGLSPELLSVWCFCRCSENKGMNSFNIMLSKMSNPSHSNKQEFSPDHAVLININFSEEYWARGVSLTLSPDSGYNSEHSLGSVSQKQSLKGEMTGNLRATSMLIR